MDIIKNWPRLRRLFADAFGSSFHFSIATVSPDGSPHVTPIGSLLLREPGKAIYFEEFTIRMPQNGCNNPDVCVLAVRGGVIYWLLSLIRGRFRTPPAVRLYGTMGRQRAATEAELNLWNKRVGKLRFTRGYKTMWAGMQTVRELEFTKAEAVHLGAMTSRCWHRWRQVEADDA